MFDERRERARDWAEPTVVGGLARRVVLAGLMAARRIIGQHTEFAAAVKIPRADMVAISLVSAATLIVTEIEAGGLTTDEAMQAVLRYVYDIRHMYREKLDLDGTPLNRPNPPL